MKRALSLFLLSVMSASLLFSCGSGEDRTSVSKLILEPEKEVMSSVLTVPEKESDNTTTTVKFVAVGDVLIHDSILKDAKNLASSSAGVSDEYYFDPMYDNVRSKISKADIAFANNETPIGGKELGISAYPSFNTPEESGDALIRLGFDVVNIATNHMLDADANGTGLENTVKFWEARTTDSFKFIGAYRSSADYNTPRIISSKGITIAFLSYTYDFPKTQGTRLNPASSSLIIPIMDENVIEQQITYAKNSADLVFVSMHWGDEYHFTPSEEQKRYARIIADAGADVIIGHHPHVIQPMEWIEGKNGNKTLCAYSLGNFISAQVNSYNVIGGMLTFDIVKEGDRKPTIENVVMDAAVTQYSANPNVIDGMGYPTRTDFKLYMFKDYNETLTKQHGIQYINPFTYEKLREYYTKYIDEEFWPYYLLRS